MKPDSTNRHFHSADLQVDPQSGQVVIRNVTISLGPVNMRVLTCLLQRHGQVVSRSELFDQVWTHQVVSDDTLTRCISELRNQLGEHSNQIRLIETLPKRGYRWLPEVFDQPIRDTNSIGAEILGAMSSWRRWLLLASAGMLLLMLFSVGFLWLTERLYQPSMVRVALIPITTDQAGRTAIAADLNDLLRDKLLATDKLGFLASSALNSRLQEPFSYYSREFGARWIIEGNIRQKQDKLRVSLSLADASTAIVVYTLMRDVNEDISELDLVCSLFIEEISAIIELDAN